MDRFDIVVVGAGMAGASLAAELAPEATVLLLEAEDSPGYHATGRSAAFWSESYGGPHVQPLTTASGGWLRAPPPRFGSNNFLSPRGALHLGRLRDSAEMTTLQADFAQSGVEMAAVDPAMIIPGLNPDWSIGMIEPSCADIDVGGLHGAYLAAARRSGVEIRTRADFVAAAREAGSWRIETSDGAVIAGVLVNAAGAWADVVARRAGVAPLGIIPLRRTIAQVRVDPAAPDDLPLVIDISGNFYFKPESGGRLWLSPHDETPVAAGDAAPDEIDIARAIYALHGVVDWRVCAVEHRWAGLRSFAPDRLPVYGFDPASPAFFWFAGQGGFGIQTAPAAAVMAADLVLGRSPSPLVAAIDARRYAPARFSV